MSDAIDLRPDAETIESDAEEFLLKFKSRMKAVAEEVMGDLYVNCLPYIETDAWTNYREKLRLELEHEYKFSTFKQEWAQKFRRAVFVENREEISKLIAQDILKRIKHLEDCRQEFDQFRYSPGGDRYQDLKAELDDVKRNEIRLFDENARLREALAALSKRHDWTPGMGECICSEHMAAREILSRDEAKQEDE